MQQKTELKNEQHELLGKIDLLQDKETELKRKLTMEKKASEKARQDMREAEIIIEELTRARKERVEQESETTNELANSPRRPNPGETMAV